MTIEKCIDEVRRGIRLYREYAYSDKFLDAMDENAAGIVEGLMPYAKAPAPEEVKEWILEYVYGACVGLENSEGHPECIGYNRPRYTVGDVLVELGVRKA